MINQSVNNRFLLVLAELCILNSVLMVKIVFRLCMVVVWVTRTILEVKNSADKGA